ncbi:hypothetical protein S101446_00752 [Komagataeibacter europaeus]|nr:hypothetical protein S101446_00752 [Komagataeibacter europaeus]
MGIWGKATTRAGGTVMKWPGAVWINRPATVTVIMDRSIAPRMRAVTNAAIRRSERKITTTAGERRLPKAISPSISVTTTPPVAKAEIGDKQADTHLQPDTCGCGKAPHNMLAHIAERQTGKQNTTHRRRYGKIRYHPGTTVAFYSPCP